MIGKLRSELEVLLSPHEKGFISYYCRDEPSETFKCEKCGTGKTIEQTCFTNFGLPIFVGSLLVSFCENCVENYPAFFKESVSKRFESIKNSEHSEQKERLIKAGFLPDECK